MKGRKDQTHTQRLPFMLPSQVEREVDANRRDVQVGFNLLYYQPGIYIYIESVDWAEHLALAPSGERRTLAALRRSFIGEALRASQAPLRASY